MERAPIVFESVWKKFRRGERHDSLRDLIPSIVRRVSRTDWVVLRISSLGFG